MSKKLSILGPARDAKREDAKARRLLVTPVTTTDSFVNFNHKLGIGSDNALTSSSYGFNPITRDRVKLEWMHRGTWLGGVAIDLVADDMTRAGVEFLSELPPDTSEAIEHEATRLGVWGALNECVQWGRLYGGAIAVAMIDGQDMSQPLRIERVGRGAFRGITVLDRWMLEPSLNDIVTEMGPHIGLPRYYRVLANAPAFRGQVIHHSRVMVRHIGIKLPYQQAMTENLWGISVIERLYDRMVMFDMATTGAGQLVNKAFLRTFKVKGLREVIAQGGRALEGLVAYVDTMRRYQNIEGISMVDAEDELEGQSHQAFSGLSDALVQFGQQLSGALQVPLVRLFGQSPAGLSATGESDLRTYYDHIKQQQVKTLHHGVTTTYRLIAQSNSVQTPPNFALGFRSLWDLDDTEKATISKTTVDAVAAAVDAQLIGPKTAMKELRQSSRRTGVFTNITQEQIDAATDDVGPPPGAEGMPGMPGATDDMGVPGNGDQETGPAGAPPQVGPGGRQRARLRGQAPGAGPTGGDDRQGAGA